MVEQTDYRYGPVHGWDHSKPIPGVGDLAVVITDRGNQKNLVVRLVEDDRNRQTIEVSDDLNRGHGCHTRYKRRGDIRPLHHMDKVIIEDEKTVVVTPSSPFHYSGDEAVEKLKVYWDRAFDEDATGEVGILIRKGPGLKLTLSKVEDAIGFDYVLYNIGLREKGGVSSYEMIIIDSGNKYGDEWKYIFHVQTKTGTFIQESQQQG